MTDEDQRRMLDKLLFDRYDEPWEMKVRGLAAMAVLNPQTYTGGTYFPVVPTYQQWNLGSGGYPRYRTIHVSLLPALQAHPQQALLIAEQIIHEQTRQAP